MKKSLLVLATLGFALSLNAADLTDTCKSYFSDIDKMDKNLLDAAAGENYEHTTMYPDFAKIAKEEELRDVERLFNAIGKVEVEHEREYLELKKMLDEEGFFESDEEDIWVCEVCGHVHRGKKAPGACPLCKAPKEYFKREFLG